MGTKNTVRLHESSSGYDRIDREAGIIHGVKILGLESKNKRRYLQEAINKAKAQYEGSKVFVDHVDLKEGTSKKRKTGERWGQLQNVNCQEGKGLYGDLHYLKTHRLTPEILESIERFKDAGLSHDVGGRTRTEGGEEVVYDIAEVYSVDFVQNPATNKNLFEDVETIMPATLFETLRQNIQEPLAAQLLARITEMGDLYSNATPMLDMSGDAAMGGNTEKPGTGDPAEAISMALRTAIMAILDSMGDTASKMAKIKLILGVQEKLAGTMGGALPPDASEEMPDEGAEVPEEAAADPAEDAESTDPKKSDMPFKEEAIRLRKELADLREQTRLAECAEQCRHLLESLDVEATDIRINAIANVAEADRKLLAEQFPKKKTKPAVSPGRMQEDLRKETRGLPPVGDVKAIKQLLSI